jgi:type II secretory pathway pseudopilin PulG
MKTWSNIMPFKFMRNSVGSIENTWLFLVFTLIELMIVISIVMILVSLLLPALKKVKEKTKAITCSNNQRQVYLYFCGYSGDHNDFLPKVTESLGSSSYNYWPGTLAAQGYIDKGRIPLELMCTYEHYMERTYNHRPPKITDSISAASLNWRYTYGFVLFSEPEEVAHMRISSMPKFDNAGRVIANRCFFACNIHNKESSLGDDQWYMIKKYDESQGIFFPAHLNRANIIYMHGGAGTVSMADVWNEWYAQHY